MKDSLSLDRQVFSAFYGDFSSLRDIQKASIKPLLNGRNVVLTSGTGSGKTEAVVAPLVNRYYLGAVRDNNLFLVYIAPTKALVNDLEKRLLPPLSKLGIRVGVRHGDRDDLLSSSPNVLITTPESLDVLLFRKESNLLSAKAIIIDEVHLLYNTQRGLQLSIILKRLNNFIGNSLQWVALSATVAELTHIRDFLAGNAEDAVFLSFPTERKIDAQIRQAINARSLLELVRIIIKGKKAKLLIFARSRRECERLTSQLKEDKDIQDLVFAHYSSLSSEIRVATERAFSSMPTAICIATSTLELGIDIGDIDAVILWGLPSGVDSFLQRIGRSNRRSNKTNVICMIPDDSETVPVDAVRFAAMVDAAKKGELPVRKPYDLFGAVGQQVIATIGAEGGRFTRIADLCALTAHKPYLSRNTVELILSELASNGFLQRHGYKNQYGADEGLYRLVDMKLIYGNFGIGSHTVDLFHGAKLLGEVPAVNLLRIGKGLSVRFAGKTWHVQDVGRERISLVPAGGRTEAVDFTYGGRGPQYDPFIIDRTWRLMHSDELEMDLFTRDLRSKIRAFIDRVRDSCRLNQIPYLRSTGGIRYFTFGGRLVNKAVGLITMKPGFEADEISLLVSSPIDFSTIPDSTSEYESFFGLLFEPNSEQSIYQRLLPIDLQRLEYIQEWLKDEVIPGILTRLKKAEPVPIDNSTASLMTGTDL